MSVDKEYIENLFSQVDLRVDQDSFSQKVFELVVKERKKAQVLESDNLKRVIAEEYEHLSYRVDQSSLQESTSVRNILRTRRLANILIDDEGHLIESLLPRVMGHLNEFLHSLGPDRQFDAKRQLHLLRVLEQLRDNPKMRRMLQRIGKPHMHKFADQIIRDTLQLEPRTVITDAHARRAVLSAWMCLLRQSVGSCFATAPAIVVHEEQPEVFLQDLNELLGTGRLKRTFGGVEYAVPLSYSWGAGDLRRMFLLTPDLFTKKEGIWNSPGLEAALEAVGLFEEEEGDRSERIFHLLQDSFADSFGKKEYLLITTEEIIRKILLKHFELTEEELADYELRPRGMIHGGLLMTVGQTEAAGGGKGKLCAKFLQEFQIAKNAFKSLADNALLKSWEFTVASFAETKAQFTSWNLYSSLGLAPDDRGGIGPSLYEILGRKLDDCNRKVEDLQAEYEQVYQQLQFMKSRLKRAEDEQQAKWYRVEYQSKANEFYTLEEIRDKTQYKAKRYANLFNALVNLYYKLFPRYFQEIYDADMHEITAGPYDDSPAGFRLVYKHGRDNSAQWTRIENHLQFIDALAAFFIATEIEISHAPEMEGLESDVGEITTAIVNHVRTNEFLETAFWRMAKVHQAPLIQDPLQNLDKIEKKPWVYTSGGAMTTLVSCYFKRDEKPTEVSRWVENTMELLTFFVDTMKKVPEKISEEYAINPEKIMLIHSPTHAFQFKPGYQPFQKAWKTKEFTYTWLRDQMIQPMKEFSAQIFVEQEQMQAILEHLLPKVSPNYQPYFKQFFGGIRGSMLLQDFRQHLVDSIQTERGLQIGNRAVLSEDEIDAAIYSMIPLFRSYHLEERLKNVLNELPGLNSEQKEIALSLATKFADQYGGQKVVHTKRFRDLLLAILLLTTGKTSTAIDYPYEILKACRSLGYAPPLPILFADSNWVKDEFGFVVNPGTGLVEFWRMDYLGSTGAPMSVWDEWLNGSKKKPDWGLYVKPYEYKI